MDFSNIFTAENGWALLEKFGEALNKDSLRSLGNVVFEDGSSGTFIVQVQGAGEGAEQS